jgi:hypothetical protein
MLGNCVENAVESAKGYAEAAAEDARKSVYQAGGSEKSANAAYARVWQVAFDESFEDDLKKELAEYLEGEDMGGETSSHTARYGDRVVTVTHSPA